MSNAPRLFKRDMTVYTPTGTGRRGRAARQNARWAAKAGPVTVRRVGDPPVPPAAAAVDATDTAGPR